ncbi:MAG TPA: FAD-dependent oxidoreductase [Rhizomicrobium sp.]|nr:FAD-dependent oxidoreductase [Rhizomicrobium sp.]
MRYDAVILGAGPDGLAAAARLARAGLKTIVLERTAAPGGLCTTREFHPGFRASLYMDEVPPIPVGVFWSLDIARHGAIFGAPPAQALLGDAGVKVIAERAFAPVGDRVRARIARELSRTDAEADALPPLRRWFSLPRPFRIAALESWESQSLQEALADCPADVAAAMTARALSGRVGDPSLRGTALHLLAPGAGTSGTLAGGVGALSEALAAAAREAGAEFSFETDVTGIQLEKERIRAVTVADGAAIETGAILSTLDLKRTILSLCQWSELPAPVVKRAADFRMQGSTARVLLALDALPEGGDPRLLRSVIHAAHSAEERARATAAWRQKIIPEQPPVSIRVVSATDPRLAPLGKASVTVTFGCIPHRLFDGDWTAERRDTLRAHVNALLDAAFPGAKDKVVGATVMVPPDFEEALGVTDGDLFGGEIAADQMFAHRAWPEWPRTPVGGLYLAGPSSAIGPVATAASGWIAAKALVVDSRAGRLA